MQNCKNKTFSVLILSFSFIFLFSSAFIIPVTARAQLAIPTSAQAGTLVINAYPSNPAPHTQVKIEIEDYSIDLTRSTVTWYVGGSKYSSGVGQTSIQLDSGDNGVTTKIVADVVTQDGQEIENSVTLQPTVVDMTFQASSYTPPFYEGKALFPYQGTITFIAMPDFTNANGSQMDPSRMIYNWEKDGQPVGTSGYGKDSLTLTGSVIAGPMDITVDATSYDGSLTGEGNISISPQAPQIIFYEDNALYGIRYDNALPASFKLGEQEFNVRAAPYFASSYSPHDDSETSYAWQINGTEVDPIQDGTDELTLRKTSGISGESIISASISEGDKILQTANSSITVNF